MDDVNHCRLCGCRDSFLIHLSYEPSHEKLLDFIWETLHVKLSHSNRTICGKCIGALESFRAFSKTVRDFRGRTDGHDTDPPGQNEPSHGSAPYLDTADQSSQFNPSILHTVSLANLEPLQMSNIKSEHFESETPHSSDSNALFHVDHNQLLVHSIKSEMPDLEPDQNHHHQSPRSPSNIIVTSTVNDLPSGSGQSSYTPWPSNDAFQHHSAREKSQLQEMDTTLFKRNVDLSSNENCKLSECDNSFVSALPSNHRSLPTNRVLPITIESNRLFPSGTASSGTSNFHPKKGNSKYLDYVCSHCSTQLTSRIDMLDHLFEQHRIEVSNRISPSYYYQHLCILCNQKFDSYNAARTHRKVHMDRNSDRSSLMTDWDETGTIENISDRGSDSEELTGAVGNDCSEIGAVGRSEMAGRNEPERIKDNVDKNEQSQSHHSSVQANCQSSDIPVDIPTNDANDISRTNLPNRCQSNDDSVLKSILVQSKMNNLVDFYFESLLNQSDNVTKTDDEFDHDQFQAQSNVQLSYNVKIESFNEIKDLCHKYKTDYRNVLKIENVKANSAKFKLGIIDANGDRSSELRDDSSKGNSVNESDNSFRRDTMNGQDKSCRVDTDFRNVDEISGLVVDKERLLHTIGDDLKTSTKPNTRLTIEKDFTRRIDCCSSFHSCGDKKKYPYTSDCGNKENNPHMSDCDDKENCPHTLDCGDKENCTNTSDCGDKEKCSHKSDCGDKENCPHTSGCDDKENCPHTSDCGGKENCPHTSDYSDKENCPHTSDCGDKENRPHTSGCCDKENRSHKSIHCVNCSRLSSCVDEEKCPCLSVCNEETHSHIRSNCDKDYYCSYNFIFGDKRNEVNEKMESNVFIKNDLPKTSNNSCSEHNDLKEQCKTIVKVNETYDTLLEDVEKNYLVYNKRLNADGEENEEEDIKPSNCYLRVVQEMDKENDAYNENEAQEENQEYIDAIEEATNTTCQKHFLSFTSSENEPPSCRSLGGDITTKDEVVEEYVAINDNDDDIVEVLIVDQKYKKNENNEACVVSDNFQCNLCNIYFDRIEDLTGHMKTHANDFKRHNFQRLLNNYLNRVNNSTEIECLFCESVVNVLRFHQHLDRVHHKDRFELPDPIIRNEMNQCTLCKDEFKRYAMYESHIKACYIHDYIVKQIRVVAHRDDAGSSGSSGTRGVGGTKKDEPKNGKVSRTIDECFRDQNLDVRPRRKKADCAFYCDACRLDCVSKLQLDIHEYYHTSYAKRLQLTYECKECDVTYTTLSGARAHLKKLHLKVESAKYFCGHCLRTYRTQVEYVRHYRDEPKLKDMIRPTSDLADGEKGVDKELNTGQDGEFSGANEVRSENGADTGGRENFFLINILKKKLSQKIFAKSLISTKGEKERSQSELKTGDSLLDDDVPIAKLLEKIKEASNGNNSKQEVSSHVCETSQLSVEDKCDFQQEDGGPLKIGNTSSMESTAVAKSLHEIDNKVEPNGNTNKDKVSRSKELRMLLGPPSKSCSAVEMKMAISASNLRTCEMTIEGIKKRLYCCQFCEMRFFSSSVCLEHMTNCKKNVTYVYRTRIKGSGVCDKCNVFCTDLVSHALAIHGRSVTSEASGDEKLENVKNDSKTSVREEPIGDRQDKIVPEADSVIEKEIDSKVENKTEVSDRLQESSVMPNTDDSSSMPKFKRYIYVQKCPLCNIQIKMISSNYNRHLEHCKNVGNNSLKCKFCKKLFRNKASKTLHQNACTKANATKMFNKGKSKVYLKCMLCCQILRYSKEHHEKVCSKSAEMCSSFRPLPSRMDQEKLLVKRGSTSGQEDQKETCVIREDQKEKKQIEMKCTKEEEKKEKVNEVEQVRRMVKTGVANSNEGVNKCSKCQKTFQLRFAYRKHIAKCFSLGAVRTSQRRENDGSGEEKKDDSKDFGESGIDVENGSRTASSSSSIALKCFLCGVTYSRPGNLYIHYQRTHSLYIRLLRSSNQSMRTYECVYCKKPCGSFLKFNLHGHFHEKRHQMMFGSNREKQVIARRSFQYENMDRMKEKNEKRQANNPLVIELENKSDASAPTSSRLSDKSGSKQKESPMGKSGKLKSKETKAQSVLGSNETKSAQEKSKVGENGPPRTSNSISHTRNSCLVSSNLNTSEEKPASPLMGSPSNKAYRKLTENVKITNGYIKRKRRKSASFTKCDNCREYIANHMYTRHAIQCIEQLRRRDQKQTELKVIMSGYRKRGRLKRRTKCIYCNEFIRNPEYHNHVIVCVRKNKYKYRNIQAEVEKNKEIDDENKPLSEILSTRNETGTKKVMAPSVVVPLKEVLVGGGLSSKETNSKRDDNRSNNKEVKDLKEHSKSLSAKKSSTKKDVGSKDALQSIEELPSKRSKRLKKVVLEKDTNQVPKETRLDSNKVGKDVFKEVNISTRRSMKDANETVMDHRLQAGREMSSFFGKDSSTRSSRESSSHVKVVSVMSTRSSKDLSGGSSIKEDAGRSVKESKIGKSGIEMSTRGAVKSKTSSGKRSTSNPSKPTEANVKCLLCETKCRKEVLPSHYFYHQSEVSWKMYLEILGMRNSDFLASSVAMGASSSNNAIASALVYCPLCEKSIEKSAMLRNHYSTHRSELNWAMYVELLGFKSEQDFVDFLQNKHLPLTRSKLLTLTGTAWRQENRPILEQGQVHKTNILKRRASVDGQSRREQKSGVDVTRKSQRLKSDRVQKGAQNSGQNVKELDTELKNRRSKRFGSENVELLSIESTKRRKQVLETSDPILVDENGSDLSDASLDDPLNDPFACLGDSQEKYDKVGHSTDQSYTTEDEESIGPLVDEDRLVLDWETIEQKSSGVREEDNSGNTASSEVSLESKTIVAKNEDIEFSSDTVLNELSEIKTEEDENITMMFTDNKPIIDQIQTKDVENESKKVIGDSEGKKSKKTLLMSEPTSSKENENAYSGYTNLEGIKTIKIKYSARNDRLDLGDCANLVTKEKKNEMKKLKKSAETTIRLKQEDLMEVDIDKEQGNSGTNESESKTMKTGIKVKSKLLLKFKKEKHKTNVYSVLNKNKDQVKSSDPNLPEKKKRPIKSLKVSNLSTITTSVGLANKSTPSLENKSKGTPSLENKLKISTSLETKIKNSMSSENKTKGSTSLKAFDPILIKHSSPLLLNHAKSSGNKTVINSLRNFKFQRDRSKESSHQNQHTDQANSGTFEKTSLDVNKISTSSKHSLSSSEDKDLNKKPNLDVSKHTVSSEQSSKLPSEKELTNHKQVEKSENSTNSIHDESINEATVNGVVENSRNENKEKNDLNEIAANKIADNGLPKEDNLAGKETICKDMETKSAHNAKEYKSTELQNESNIIQNSFNLDQNVSEVKSKEKKTELPNTSQSMTNIFGNSIDQVSPLVQEFNMQSLSTTSVQSISQEKSVLESSNARTQINTTSFENNSANNGITVNNMSNSSMHSSSQGSSSTVPGIVPHIQEPVPNNSYQSIPISTNLSEDNSSLTKCTLPSISSLMNIKPLTNRDDAHLNLSESRFSVDTQSSSLACTGRLEHSNASQNHLYVAQNLINISSDSKVPFHSSYNKTTVQKSACLTLPKSLNDNQSVGSSKTSLSYSDLPTNSYSSNTHKSPMPSPKTPNFSENQYIAQHSPAMSSNQRSPICSQSPRTPNYSEAQYNPQHSPAMSSPASPMVSRSKTPASYTEMSSQKSPIYNQSPRTPNYSEAQYIPQHSPAMSSPASPMLSKSKTPASYTEMGSQKSPMCNQSPRTPNYSEAQYIAQHSPASPIINRSKTPSSYTESNQRSPLLNQSPKLPNYNQGSPMSNPKTPTFPATQYVSHHSPVSPMLNSAKTAQAYAADTENQKSPMPPSPNSSRGQNYNIDAQKSPCSSSGQSKTPVYRGSPKPPSNPIMVAQKTSQDYLVQAIRCQQVPTPSYFPQSSPSLVSYPQTTYSTQTPLYIDQQHFSTPQTHTYITPGSSTYTSLAYLPPNQSSNQPMLQTSHHHSESNQIYTNHPTSQLIDQTVSSLPQTTSQKSSTKCKSSKAPPVSNYPMASGSCSTMSSQLSYASPEKPKRRLTQTYKSSCESSANTGSAFTSVFAKESAANSLPSMFPSSTYMYSSITSPAVGSSSMTASPNNPPSLSMYSNNPHVSITSSAPSYVLPTRVEGLPTFESYQSGQFLSYLTTHHGTGPPPQPQYYSPQQ